MSVTSSLCAMLSTGLASAGPEPAPTPRLPVPTLLDTLTVRHSYLTGHTHTHLPYTNSVIIRTHTRLLPTYTWLPWLLPTYTWLPWLLPTHTHTPLLPTHINHAHFVTIHALTSFSLSMVTMRHRSVAGGVAVPETQCEWRLRPLHPGGE